MEVGSINSECNSIFPLEIYSSYLKTIDGVAFTHREIDIIACILGGRANKKIASFLSISPKTVDNHIRNIMLKLGISSRESLIDFIEKSGKYTLFKKYYLNLLILEGFELELGKISSISIKQNVTSVIICDEEKNKAPLFFYLKKHLELAGIKTIVLEESKNKCQNNNNKIKSFKATNIIYVLSLENAEITNVGLNQQINNLKAIQLSMESKNSNLLLVVENNIPIEIPNELFQCEYIDFSDHGKYCFLIFELLKKILSSVTVEANISAFNQFYKKIFDHDQLLDISIDEKNSIRSTGGLFNMNLKNNKKWLLVGMSVCIILIGLLFMIFERSVNHQHLRVVRSEFRLPHESFLLKRSLQIDEINNKFTERKGKKGIQTVALVGIGGSGKTTLSQMVAGSQNTDIIWIIDSETREGLLHSYERLAYALSETEEERRELKGIQELKLDIEREQKLTFFLKGKLKSRSNWFLIYDNVEAFDGILTLFPQDPEVWGEGKIIITTRDSNINNNKYINPNNVVHIKELEDKEKSSLLTSILYGTMHRELDPIQKKLADDFLREIPPFPLDISTAALYIKDTKISYQEYLERMQAVNKEFDQDQESLLKVTGEYTKTRYGIIAMTIQKIIEEYPNFTDLLLFISMLDSQNIPRDLLNINKSETISGKFIRTLKKHSFILDEENSPNISIHRSIQAISLSYLTKALNLKKGDPLLDNIANTLENYMLNAMDKVDNATMYLLIEHGEKFLNHSSLLTEAIKGRIMSKLGCMHSYSALYVKSKELLEHSLDILNRYDNKNYRAIAQCVTCSALSHWNAGNYEEVELMAEKALKIFQSSLPEEYSRMALLLRCLGNASRELGKYEEAQSYLQQSLNLYKKENPQNQIGVAGTLAFLGFTYYELGDYHRAREVLEQSLAICKKHPESYLNNTRTLIILGMIYRKLNDYEKAKALTQAALTIHMKDHYHKHSFSTAWNLGCLGNIYAELGDYKNAKNLIEQCLEVFKKNYGENHLRVANVLSDLGYAYLLEGRMEDAEVILNDSLKKFEKIKHAGSYIALENLSELYVKKYESAAKKGNHSEVSILKKQAIDYLQQALEIAKMRFPEDSPHIPRIEDKLKNLDKRFALDTEAKDNLVATQMI